MCRLKAPSQPAPQPAPVTTDAAVQQAGVDARDRALKRRGFGTTLLTGPAGAAGPTPTATRTLLGLGS